MIIIFEILPDNQVISNHPVVCFIWFASWYADDSGKQRLNILQNKNAYNRLDCPIWTDQFTVGIPTSVLSKNAICILPFFFWFFMIY